MQRKTHLSNRKMLKKIQMAPFEPNPIGTKKEEADGSEQGIEGLSGNGVLPKNHQLQGLWSQEFKSFLYLSAKKEGKWAKILKNELMCVLNLLGQQFASGTSSIRPNSIVKGKYKILTCTINHSKKFYNRPVIVILSHAITQLPRLDLTYSLDVIELYGKIVYNTIFLKNWKAIQQQLASIQKYFKVIRTVIEEKEELLSLISDKQTKLLELIDDSSDLREFAENSTDNIKEEVGKLNPGKKRVCQNLQTDQIFREPSLQFIFIRNQLNNSLKKTQPHNVPKHMHFLALTHNLILPVLQSTQVPLRHQVDHLLPSLKQCLVKVVDQHVSRSISLHTHHHPISLTNAHFCYSCKKNRIYIACSSCSNIEGKTIALCLDCYGNYHRTSISHSQNNLMLPTYDNWQLLDQSITSLVNFALYETSHPVKQLVKSEDQE